jgi:hypothetical protein
MLMIPSISDILGKMKIQVDLSFDLLSAEACSAASSATAIRD